MTSLHNCKENLTISSWIFEEIWRNLDQLAVIQKHVANDDKVSWLFIGLGPDNMHFVDS